MPEPPANWALHLGRRLSLRYVLEDGTHTELVGVLQGTGEGPSGPMIKVLDRRGRLHVIEQARVVAARIL